MELQPYNWWRAQPGTICSDLWILVAETPDGRFSWSRPPTQENASQVTELWPQKTQSGTSMRFRWVSKENLRIHPRNFWPQWFVNDVDFFWVSILLFRMCMLTLVQGCVLNAGKVLFFWWTEGWIDFWSPIGRRMCLMCQRSKSVFFSFWSTKKKLLGSFMNKKLEYPWFTPWDPWDWHIS